MEIEGVAEEMESWARFRAAIEMSEGAMKPDDVRAVVEDSFASSAAREHSRRALAFSLFSSWASLGRCGMRGRVSLTIRCVTS